MCYTQRKDDEKDRYSTDGTKKQTEHKRGSNRTGNRGEIPATGKGRNAGCHQRHSAITDRVIGTEEWQNRPLKKFCPFLFAGCIYVTIRKEMETKNCAVYVVLIMCDGFFFAIPKTIARPNAIESIPCTIQI